MTITVWIIFGYLGLLLLLGLVSKAFSKGTSSDFFVIGRSVGPFLLLMSVFGTTMTGFALIGSTGKAYTSGIGVYGLMASWSGLMHSAVFFLIGIRLWAIGKRHGYLTQCQYFRARYDSPLVAYLLFPALVLLVIPYLLVGVIGAGNFLRGATRGLFMETFPETAGGIPAEWGGLLICCVVLFYVFAGGMRGAVWANTLQTTIFMATGVIAFFLIARQLGGLQAATQMVVDSDFASDRLVREGQMGHLQFFSYFLIPLSVGMFPHIFQHWLTARSARSFRLAVVAHPLFIMIVWVPTILIGTWAAAAIGPLGEGQNPNMILGLMVNTLIESPVLSGILAAGVLAAIMSSLDSQFMCLGTMFTNDVVLRLTGRDRFTDRQKILIGRLFIIGVVAVTYALAMLLKDTTHVFDLGIWCFAGFSGLFPIVFASVYWRRATAAGVVSAMLVTASIWVFLFLRDILGDKAPGEEMLILGMMPVAPIFLASATTLIIVSLFTRPPSESTLRKFFIGRE